MANKVQGGACTKHLLDPTMSKEMILFLLGQDGGRHDGYLVQDAAQWQQYVIADEIGERV